MKSGETKDSTVNFRLRINTLTGSRVIRKNAPLSPIKDAAYPNIIDPKYNTHKYNAVYFNLDSGVNP
ncbi:MAG TPA: hypothetical protein PLG67_08535 [Bacillota bacterium]|nr:hypothetical protein [Bacillota bacterium]HQE65970.1 hypothetical protein [Bacillota bacterium]HQL36624.1 hypothetical protein [Bacillota bacterium]